MQALKVAEALAPGADDAVEVLQQVAMELFICTDCFLKPIDLVLLAIRRAAEEEKTHAR